METTAFHHTPSRLSEGTFQMLAAFHAADALVDAGRHTLAEESLDVEFLERAGVLGQLPRWRSVAAETLRIGSA